MESLFYHSRALAENESILGENRWRTPQEHRVGKKGRQAVGKPKPANLPPVPRCSQLSQPYWMAFFTLERQLMRPWASHIHWEMTKDQHNRGNANQLGATYEFQLSELSMVTHTVIPALGGSWGRRTFMSSRLAWTTELDPISKILKKSSPAPENYIRV